ncbi:MAG TPA: hypothetical protein VK892_15730 [Pyrinomonadaceae bacterium]|nr:hypothetical protein [Pyrinomonadaceae bacterium]
MKEDYLWDKTGADPEIEKLENALKAFRYKESEPPALPAKIIPFERKSPRRFFQLAFAFAASAALVLISFGVWIQFSMNNQIHSVDDLAQSIIPQIDVEIPEEISEGKLRNADLVKPADLPSPKINTSKPTKRKIVKASRFVPVRAAQNQTIARKTEVKNRSVALTEEEKYAYNQLMLALSITSSKLKMVKDRVEGVEE